MTSVVKGLIPGKLRHKNIHSLLSKKAKVYKHLFEVRVEKLEDIPEEVKFPPVVCVMQHKSKVVSTQRCTMETPGRIEFNEVVGMTASLMAADGSSSYLEYVVKFKVKENVGAKSIGKVAVNLADHAIMPSANETVDPSLPAYRKVLTLPISFRHKKHSSSTAYLTVEVASRPLANAVDLSDCMSDVTDLSVATSCMSSEAGSTASSQSGVYGFGSMFDMEGVDVEISTPPSPKDIILGNVTTESPAVASIPPDQSAAETSYLISSKFHSEGVVEFEDFLPDEFYDPGMLPTQRFPGIDECSSSNSHSVSIFVDRRSDDNLRKVIEDVRPKVWKQKSAEKKYNVIARTVAVQMGGKGKNIEQQSSDFLQKLASNARSSVIPIGVVEFGGQRQRSVLFKVLCDQMAVPCRLRRRAIEEKIVYWVEVHCEGQLQVVNLLQRPGEMYESGGMMADEYIAGGLIKRATSSQLLGTQIQEMRKKYMNAFRVDIIEQKDLHVKPIDGAYSCLGTVLGGTVKTAEGGHDDITFKALTIVKNNILFIFADELAALHGIKNEALVPLRGALIEFSHERSWIAGAVYNSMPKSCSLHDYIHKYKFPMNPSQIQGIAHWIARALLALHTREPPIPHGHLNSHNVILSITVQQANEGAGVRDFESHGVDHRGDGIIVDIHQVAVTDYGFSGTAREMATSKGHSEEIYDIAMAPYLAPEYNRHAGAATPAEDIYAFGIICWEMVLGQMPWTGLSPSDMLDFVRRGERPPRPGKREIKGFHKSFIPLMVKCWSDPATARPTIHSVHNSLTMLSGKK